MALVLIGAVAAGAIRVHFDVDGSDKVTRVVCQNDTPTTAVRVDVRRGSANWVITNTALPLVETVLAVAKARQFRYSDEATSDWSVSISVG